MQLSDTLWLEKINLNKNAHTWLLDTLNKENPSSQSFIWNFKKEIQKRTDNYLERPDILYSPFALYSYDHPVGYLEISDIYNSGNYVCLIYALLKKEQKKGYASRTLLNISKILLNEYKQEIQKVILTIDSNNKESITLAKRCGFYTLDTPIQIEQNGICTYEKSLNPPKNM